MANRRILVWEALTLRPQTATEIANKVGLSTQMTTCYLRDAEIYWGIVESYVIKGKRYYRIK